MEIQHVNLWRYEEQRDATDCDGNHSSSRAYTSHREPSELVFSKADLFAAGGPSRASLDPKSTPDKGSADIGHGTDEGSCGWTISWERVTSKEELDKFLEELTSYDGMWAHEVESLYKARIRGIVQSKFAGASMLAFDPPARRGEPWTITKVYADNEYRMPKPVWSGDGTEMPFTQEEIAEISRDLEVIYEDAIVEPGSALHL